MSANAIRIFLPLPLIFAAACEAPPRPDTPTELFVRIPDREAFFDDALTRLRESDFQPRLADRRDGLIIAGPTTSAQWFEWWRGDSPGMYQTFESSIHTVRRTVTVKLDPLNPAPTVTTPAITPAELASPPEPPPARGEFRLAVRVDKERYSAPERQATTALGAMAIYNERLPTVEGLRNARSVGEHWVSLGRDVELEAFWLDRLASLGGVSTITSTAPASASPPSGLVSP